MAEVISISSYRPLQHCLEVRTKWLTADDILGINAGDYVFVDAVHCVGPTGKAEGEELFRVYCPEFEQTVVSQRLCFLALDKAASANE